MEVNGWKGRSMLEGQLDRKGSIASITGVSSSAKQIGVEKRCVVVAKAFILGSRHGGLSYIIMVRPKEIT